MASEITVLMARYTNRGIISIPSQEANSLQGQISLGTRDLADRLTLGTQPCLACNQKMTKSKSILECPHDALYQFSENLKEIFGGGHFSLFSLLL